MLRVVVDTNILISGAFWDGPPKRIINAIRTERILALISDETVAELRITLQRTRFQVYAAKTNQDLVEWIDAFVAVALES